MSSNFFTTRMFRIKLKNRNPSHCGMEILKILLLYIHLIRNVFGFLAYHSSLLPTFNSSIHACNFFSCPFMTMQKLILFSRNRPGGFASRANPVVVHETETSKTTAHVVNIPYKTMHIMADLAPEGK